MPVQYGDHDVCVNCKGQLTFDIPPALKERPWGRMRPVWYHDVTGLAKCGDPENREDDRHANPVHWCDAKLTGNDRYGEICNRSVKEYGRCGVHMEDARKQYEREQKINELMQQDEYVEEELGSVVESWNVAYDLDAHLEETVSYRKGSTYHYRSGYARYTGYVVVNPARLNELMKNIEEELI